MRFDPPLIRGRLIQRYKRFLCDIELETGETVVAHCANPGSMAGLAEPGSEVWLSPANNPKRKLQWTWELVADRMTRSLVGINTNRANAIVEEALHLSSIDDSLAFTALRREVAYGEGSRVDFLLTDESEAPVYLEVKSVTLRRSEDPPHRAEFPDAVTKRGAKHLLELAAICAGAQHPKPAQRSALLYLVQRQDCEAVSLASDIDPHYAVCARKAADAGVEMFAVACRVSPEEIAVDRPLPLIL